MADNQAKTWGTNREGRRDKNRRRRWFTSVNKCKTLTRGQKATAFGLAERSSDTAKPVWGRQTGFADEIGCSDRQLRRDIGALEHAGLITVTRFKPERQADGKCRRPRTNIYIFCVPAGKANRRNASSVQQDISALKNPLPTEELITSRKSESKEDEDPPPSAWKFDRSLIDAARGRLPGA